MGQMAWALAWLSGLVLQQQQPRLWPALAYVGCALAFVLIGGFAMRLRALAWMRMVLGVVLSAGLAWCWSGWRATLLPGLGVHIPEPQIWLVRGVITEWPRQWPGGASFVLQVQSRQFEGEAWRPDAARLRLSWYEMPPEVSLEVGQHWQMQVKVRPPHGYRNPQGDDSERRAWREGLTGVGYVVSRTELPTLRWARVPDGLMRWRDPVYRRLMATDLTPRAKAWLAALVLGERSMLTPDDWQVLQATGTAHLLSVSGLHVTVWAGLAWALVGRLWRVSVGLWPAAALRWPRVRVAGVAALLLALLYALLAGWGVPVQRAWLMLATFAGLRLWALRWPSALSLLSAAVVVTVWDPWAVTQAGFWLSFIAVWALAMALEPRAHNAVQRARRLWFAQWRIGWVLMPVSAWWMGQVSWLGFGVNMLAIPWVTLAVLPAALLGLLWPGFWQLAWWLLSPMVHVLDGLLAFAGSAWQVTSPPAVWALLAVAGVYLGMRFLEPRWRLVGMAWALPALLWRSPAPPHGVFSVLAWDVGQGTAVLVRTARHSLLYDTGPGYWRGGDAADRLVLPAMRAAGISADALVWSHQDADHVGGRLSVRRAFPIARIWSSFSEKGATMEPCLAGKGWTWDGVRFSFVHPLRPAQGRANNGDSCVLLIEAQGGSALLPGDIGVDQERQLIAQGAMGHVDLLLAAHHGSKTSSSEVWLHTLQPKWIWVQAGFANRYGHPHDQVVQRWRSLGLSWRNTADCGALHWRSDAPAQSTCERELAPHYWSHAPKRVTSLSSGP